MTTMLSPVTHVFTYMLEHLYRCTRIPTQCIFTRFHEVARIRLILLKGNFGQQTHSSGSEAFLGPSPLFNIHGKAGGRGT